MEERYKIQSSFLGTIVTYVAANKRLGLMIGGRIYYYYGVTRNKLTRFLKAESKGRYFGKYIKGQYKTRRYTL